LSFHGSGVKFSQTPRFDMPFQCMSTAFMSLEHEGDVLLIAAGSLSPRIVVFLLYLDSMRLECVFEAETTAPVSALELLVMEDDNQSCRVLWGGVQGTLGGWSLIVDDDRKTKTAAARISLSPPSWRCTSTFTWSATHRDAIRHIVPVNQVPFASTASSHRKKRSSSDHNRQDLIFTVGDDGYLRAWPLFWRSHNTGVTAHARDANLRGQELWSSSEVLLEVPSALICNRNRSSSAVAVAVAVAANEGGDNALDEAEMQEAADYLQLIVTDRSGKVDHYGWNRQGSRKQTFSATSSAAVVLCGGCDSSHLTTIECDGLLRVYNLLTPEAADPVSVPLFQGLSSSKADGYDGNDGNDHGSGMHAFPLRKAVMGACSLGWAVVLLTHDMQLNVGYVSSQ
jgi:hypothetical protein